MEISPILQARLLLYSAVFGAALGVLYDLLETLRLSVNMPKFIHGTIRFIGDLLIMSVAGVGTVLLCYYFNKGEIRFFVLLGMTVAFFIYRVTLSHLIRPAFRFVLKLFYVIVRQILAPLVKIFKYSVNIFKKIIYNMLKVLEKLIALVYNIVVMRSIISKSKKGFLENNGNRKK